MSRASAVARPRRPRPLPARVVRVPALAGLPRGKPINPLPPARVVSDLTPPVGPIAPPRHPHALFPALATITPPEPPGHIRAPPHRPVFLPYPGVNRQALRHLLTSATAPAAPPPPVDRPPPAPAAQRPPPHHLPNHRPRCPSTPRTPTYARRTPYRSSSSHPPAAVHLFIPPTTPDVGPCCLGPRALAGASRPARVPGPLLAPGPCCLGHPTSLRSPPHPRYPASRCPERTREDPARLRTPAPTTSSTLQPFTFHPAPTRARLPIWAGTSAPARPSPGPARSRARLLRARRYRNAAKRPTPHPCPSTRGEQHLPARPSIPSRTPRLLPLARYPLHLPAPPARSREITRAAPTPTPSGLSYQLPNKPTSRQADKPTSRQVGERTNHQLLLFLPALRPALATLPRPSTNTWPGPSPGLRLIWPAPPAYPG